MKGKDESILETGQVFLLKKPLYWTSFDLVNKIRVIIKSALGIKKIKVGHAGTLDPLATGLMIVCTGRATRRIEEFRDLDKEYIATIRLGETTPSYDLETETDRSYPTGHITEKLVREVLEKFIGQQEQVPPLYSAKFIDGKRAYEFARKGIERELKPVTIFFREIELIQYEFPEIKVRMLCSKGTYIRAFARDLGEALNSGGYLSALERTAIGSYRITDAWETEKFREYVEQLRSSYVSGT
jgi:tRNA pseudouridine55 synthase